MFQVPLDNEDLVLGYASGRIQHSFFIPILLRNSVKYLEFDQSTSNL
nr:translational initiation factor 1 [Ricinus communis]